MAKNREQLYKDVQAAIKAVLCDVERLAALEPAVACAPGEFNEVRRSIVRRIWQLYKDAVTMRD